MSVFHGNWNEDPREFLTSYLQHTAASGNNFKARQFINYLGAGSEANDWFDELSHEEKKDWVAIECSFRKRWLNEEVLSIKETITYENESHSPPTSAPTITSHIVDMTKMEPQLTPTAENQDKESPEDFQMANTVATPSTTTTAPPHNSKLQKVVENGSNELQVYPHFPEITQNQVFLPNKPFDTPATSSTMSSTPTKSKTTSSSHFHHQLPLLHQNHPKLAQYDIFYCLQPPLHL
jgi:hypothetical protein